MGTVDDASRRVVETSANIRAMVQKRLAAASRRSMSADAAAGEQGSAARRSHSSGQTGHRQPLAELPKEYQHLEPGDGRSNPKQFEKLAGVRRDEVQYVRARSKVMASLNSSSASAARAGGGNGATGGSPLLEQRHPNLRPRRTDSGALRKYQDALPQTIESRLKAVRQRQITAFKPVRMLRGVPDSAAPGYGSPPKDPRPFRGPAPVPHSRSPSPRGGDYVTPVRQGSASPRRQLQQQQRARSSDSRPTLADQVKAQMTARQAERESRIAQLAEPKGGRPAPRARSSSAPRSASASRSASPQVARGGGASRHCDPTASTLSPSRAAALEVIAESAEEDGAAAGPRPRWQLSMNNSTTAASTSKYRYQQLLQQKNRSGSAADVSARSASASTAATRGAGGAPKRHPVSGSVVAPAWRALVPRTGAGSANRGGELAPHPSGDHALRSRLQGSPQRYQYHSNDSDSHVDGSHVGGPDTSVAASSRGTRAPQATSAAELLAAYEAARQQRPPLAPHDRTSASAGPEPEPSDAAPVASPGPSRDKRPSPEPIRTPPAALHTSTELSPLSDRSPGGADDGNDRTSFFEVHVAGGRSRPNLSAIAAATDDSDAHPSAFQPSWPPPLGEAQPWGGQQARGGYPEAPSPSPGGAGGGTPHAMRPLQPSRRPGLAAAAADGGRGSGSGASDGRTAQAPSGQHRRHADPAASHLARSKQPAGPVPFRQPAAATIANPSVTRADLFGGFSSPRDQHHQQQPPQQRFAGGNRAPMLRSDSDDDDDDDAANDGYDESPRRRMRVGRPHEIRHAQHAPAPADAGAGRGRSTSPLAQFSRPGGSDAAMQLLLSMAQQQGASPI